MPYLLTVYNFLCMYHIQTDPDAKPVSGTDNPGFKAAHTYEELSMITVSSVYDELKNDDNGPDNSQMNRPLDESKSKSHVYFGNVKNDDPVYNNTVLENAGQTFLLVEN
ncbi:hypothetical protein MAR_019864 [Mya arenaria]|uniref:Uncharacterized protein n=1 Tax=Mya arenaria TaxID=6604 RepID=A0ABY7E6C9_MYAAR|nr:hypothetical protein MAR_019864 [Mya arenaria]